MSGSYPMPHILGPTYRKHLTIRIVSIYSIRAGNYINISKKDAAVDAQLLLLRHNLYFHGTAMQNIESILKNGFQTNETNGTTATTTTTAKHQKHLRRFNNEQRRMFGNVGCFYFADVLAKAAKFSETQHILACRLHFKKPIHLTHDYDSTADLPNRPYDAIIGLGKYNKFGHLCDLRRPLNYNEYVVFDNCQIEPIYIVHVDLQKKKHQHQHRQ